jgi:Holliday junction resolvase RusA-like endonuclease
MKQQYMEAWIIPSGKPRMTQRDRWKKRPAVMKYRRYADELRKEALTQNFELGEQLDIQFFIPIPKSWSLKKRKAHVGLSHKQRPDLDNLIKAVQDILLSEDSRIWKVYASKRWSEHGLIIINNLK